MYADYSSGSTKIQKLISTNLNKFTVPLCIHLLPIKKYIFNFSI